MRLAALCFELRAFGKPKSPSWLGEVEGHLHESRMEIAVRAESLVVEFQNHRFVVGAHEISVLGDAVGPRVEGALDQDIVQATTLGRKLAPTGFAAVPGASQRDGLPSRRVGCRSVKVSLESVSMMILWARQAWCVPISTRSSLAWSTACGMVREVERDEKDDVPRAAVHDVLTPARVVRDLQCLPSYPSFLRKRKPVPRQSLLVFPAISCQSLVLSKVVPSGTAISCKHHMSMESRSRCPRSVGRISVSVFDGESPPTFQVPV